MEERAEILQVDDISEELTQNTSEMLKLATLYCEARKNYAKCFNKITVMVYKAGLHKSSAAFENKIPMLFANEEYSDLAIDTFSNMTEFQQEYKGLEWVLKAYEKKISAIQSIIKFMQQGETNEAIRNKYAMY